MHFLTHILLLLALLHFHAALSHRLPKQPPDLGKLKKVKVPVPHAPPSPGPASSTVSDTTYKTDQVFASDVIIPAKATVSMAPGQTLTIQPKVTVKVSGTLRLEGDAQLGITLRGAAPAKGEKGGSIVLLKGGQVILKHVTVVGLGSPDDAAIEVNGPGAQLTLEAVTFQDQPGSAIEVRQGTLTPLSKITFQNVGDNAIELYGNKAGALSVTDSSFLNCRGNAIFTHRFEGNVTLQGNTFRGGDRYAVYLDGDLKFQATRNAFEGVRGAFACRKHAAHPAAAGLPSAFAENSVTNSMADLESDGWSRGNLIYIHGCALEMTKNTITGAKRAANEDTPNLLNFYDAAVTMERNDVRNNANFSCTLNVGGPLTKVTLARNLFDNVPSGAGFEIINEATGVRVGAQRNWWGAADDEGARTRIMDFRAGGERYGVVDYLPILPQPDMEMEVVDAPQVSDSFYEDYYGYGYFGDDTGGGGGGKERTVISGMETWSTDRTLGASVWVKRDAVLTITTADTGVDMFIWLKSGVSIHVEGTLRILGSEGARVVFQSEEDFEEEDKAGPWGCITMSKDAKGSTDPAEPSIIRFAEFRRGGTPPPLPEKAKASGRPAANAGMLVLLGPNVTVEDSIFRSSETAGLVAVKGRVEVVRCTFADNKGHGVVSHALKPLTVTDSVFTGNGKFSILVTHGTYNITDSEFKDGNKGVVCVRRRRAESTGGPMPLFDLSELSGNRISNNAYAAGADCWGPTGDDTVILLALAGRPVAIQDNAFLDNVCDSGAVRRGAAVVLLAADDAAAFLGNAVERSYGRIYLGRPLVSVKSWEHEPPVFRLEGNAVSHNRFFSLLLPLPERRAVVSDNLLGDNEVSDDSALKAQPLLQVAGGSFQRKPLRLTGNHLLGNEGTLLALSLDSPAIATNNWFSNPFIKYELEFTNEDPLLFNGVHNYWGEFDRDQGDDLAERIKPVKGSVPQRWYKSWILPDGKEVEVEPPNPVVRPVDKASATLTFLIVLVLGALIIAVVVAGLYCRGPGPYTVLEMDDIKPSTE